MAHNIPTDILSPDSPLLRRTREMHLNGSRGTASLYGRRDVLLIVRGMVERMTLEEGTVYHFGRFSVPQSNQIDLTIYGAAERGVSRVHAAFYLENDQIFVTDLGSTNGTHIGNERLLPDTPMLLHKGDDLLLGRLIVQFLFHG